MQNTTNLNLKKPDQTDYVNITDINDNMDVIDTALAKKYEKPSTGVPKTDLAQSIQNSLEKAETALQKVDKNSVGLGNVDNTSDANKPISTTTQSALNLKAPLASPTFTGAPTAPTPAESTNNTQLATTEFVQKKVAAHQTEYAKLLTDVDTLKKLKKERSNKDSNGTFTTVTYKQKSDGTVYAKSVLSGGTAPQYTTRTETFYDTDGTTVLATIPYTISYDADGDWVGEV